MAASVIVVSATVIAGRCRERLPVSSMLRMFFLMLLMMPFSVLGFFGSTSSSIGIRTGGRSMSSSSSAFGSIIRRSHGQMKINKVASAFSSINRITTSSTRIQMSNNSNSSTSKSKSSGSTKKYKHTLAILTLPQTSIDKIANEAILETCMRHTTDKLSIVLRCNDSSKPKLNELRGYVGEIYSMAWDAVLDVDVGVDVDVDDNVETETEGDNDGGGDGDAQQNKHELLDVVIYPQNLPNAAPESWITHRPDLQCICSHSSIIGWVSSTTHSSSSSGKFFEAVEGSGLGGLYSHVEAVNVDRRGRGLEEVEMLEVESWPDVCCQSGGQFGAKDDTVVFLEDDIDGDFDSDENKSRDTNADGGADAGTNIDTNDLSSDDAIGHYRIPSSLLFNSVAVGGTWDGVHYGHRKLLTLAISSVVPNGGGKLCIGITTDEMLTQKEYAEYIPPLKERIKGVRNFVDAFAPGMKNRIKIVPIVDAYGPPGSSPSSSSSSSVYEGIENDFDALVLSHETLPTGNKLNQYRVEKLGLEPLKLLCTRRTEAHGMSSTVLRKMRSQSRGQGQGQGQGQRRNTNRAESRQSQSESQHLTDEATTTDKIG